MYRFSTPARSEARGIAMMAVLAILLLLPAVATARPAATALRIGDHLTMTRFVLDFTEKVEYRVFTLADPYRVVVDLPTVEWRLPDAAGRQKSRLIDGYRHGLFTPERSRLVLDIKRPVAVKKAFLLEPTGPHGYRFVLDLEETDAAQFAANLRARGPAADPKKADPPVDKPRRRAGDRPLVAIDAGHGGVDPGAIGARGTYEKRITLAFAKELKRQLEATGRFRAMLTRERDIFVRLRERIAIARGAGADLFVSLHADSLRSRRARGASVYTLSNKASDKEAAALAAKENKSDLIAGIDLTHENPVVANILIDLAQRETMNESARFAKMLIREMGRDMRLLRNTHRFAGFAVLKAPDVPSVLIELGYLSNPTEERLLKTAAYREKAVGAIVRAIDSQFHPTRAARRN